MSFLKPFKNPTDQFIKQIKNKKPTMEVTKSLKGSKVLYHGHMYTKLTTKVDPSPFLSFCM